MVKQEEGCSTFNSKPDTCPICLGSFSQESYLDRCFHKFCYQCILRWIRVVSSRSSSLRRASSINCPLCKTENLSIIYGFDGSTFQKHLINQNVNSNSNFLTQDHKYRLQCYYTNPEPGLLSEAFKVERFWKLHSYFPSNSWLEKWLRRELQALIQEEDVDIIMHHILGVIESFSRSHNFKGTKCSPQQRRQDFKVLVGDAAMPFLTGRTKQFVDEMELFLASDLAIEYYDRAYRRCLGWERTEENEPTSRNHEVIVPCIDFFDDDIDESGWVEGKNV